MGKEHGKKAWGDLLLKSAGTRAPAAVEWRSSSVSESSSALTTRALFLPMSLGSDVTIQISSEDDRLTVRLPFGSHTRTFLQEVSRCSAGTSSAVCWMRPVGLVVGVSAVSAGALRLRVSPPRGRAASASLLPKLAQNCNGLQAWRFSVIGQLSRDDQRFG